VGSSTGDNGDGARKRAAKTANRTSRPSRYTPEAAKENVILLVGDGYTVTAAVEKVGRQYKTYEMWRREDPEFKRRIDQAKAMAGTRKKGRERGPKMDFVEFRRKYLNTETFWHQHQWIDILEGREPRDLHPAQTYVKGKRSRILINTPPFHAKSTTITMDYVVYKICMDPGYRVIIVSAGSTLAKHFMRGIKQRLTHPDYLDLQLAYAPDGGFRQSADAWREDTIVIGSAERDSAEKDPTVQALGIGGQIYGARADLIIVDDAVIRKNVREYEKQMSWLFGEVSNRIEMGGKLLVVGTRIAPIDLYSELMNPENYGNSKVPWTYMAQPAILEENHEDRQQSVTLWPWTDRPWQPAESGDLCDCEDPACSEGTIIDGVRRYARWDGVHLDIGPRADMSATDWALIYQQSSLNDRMVFAEHAVQKATNHKRMPGLLFDGNPAHPIGGMHGMYVVAGCDPSIKGFAGIVVIAFDPRDGKRYLLNAYNIKAPTPSELKQEMFRITEDYSVNEWRVEKTGLLQFFTQDEAMRIWFQQRGVQFKEHLTTGASKWDASFGVASCASLFGAYDKALTTAGVETGEWREIAPPQIELPRHMKGVKDLVHQLVTWTPDLDPKKVPCDLVMAFWFAEVRCRELTIRSGNAFVNPLKRFSRYSPQRNQKNRMRVNFADMGMRTGR
jgi:hypothetical protein